MLEALGWRVHGTVARHLQIIASRNAEALLRELLVQATELWESETFFRYDDGELSCTLRLFDCMDRVLHSSDPRWQLVHVQYEGGQPSIGARQGTEDPRLVPRPDIHMLIGSMGIPIEAKLIGTSGGLPRLYVREGIMRFVTGKYATKQYGAMVGYSIRDELPPGIDAVNVAVTSEPGLGTAHELRERATPAPRMLTHASHHGSVRLLHHGIDLR